VSYKHIYQNAFEPFIRVSDAVTEYLDNRLELKKFNPRALITEAGNVERYFYIVVSGVQAGYLIDRDGNKVVLAFSYPGNFTGVYDSLVSEQISHFFVESIGQSHLLALNKADFDELFVQFPEMMTWRLRFIEMILSGRGQREVEMLTSSASERFEAFMKRCPDELLQIPQKYLASYLHMKPETFSRLRARKN